MQMRTAVKKLTLVPALMVVKKHNQRTTIWIEVADKEGNWVIRPSFDYLDSFSGGTARCRENGKWGIVNSKGEWMIPPEFSNTLPYVDGLCRVSQGYRWGYADETGKVVNAPRFASASNFVNDVAIVKLGMKWGIIDRSGNFTAPAIYTGLRAPGDVSEDEESEQEDSE